LKNRSSGPCGAVAAGRLAFPADPPWPFSGLRRKGLRGLGLGGPPQPVARLRAPSMAFASSSKPPSCPGRAPVVETTTTSSAASHGIRRYAPPSTCFRVRARQRCRRRDALGCHSRGFAALVVLHHFSGLPFPQVAGVLQPAADPGVRRVSWRSACHRTCRQPRCLAFPRDALRTPRRIPSPIAAPRHRGRCTSCGSTASDSPSRPLAQPRGATGAPPIRWALAGRLLDRPPHIHPEASTTTEVAASSPRSSIGLPVSSRAPPPPPLRAEARDPTPPGERPLQGLAPPTSSCRARSGMDT
jgi:hypothetical protein